MAGLEPGLRLHFALFLGESGGILLAHGSRPYVAPTPLRTEALPKLSCCGADTLHPKTQTLQNMQQASLSTLYVFSTPGMKLVVVGSQDPGSYFLFGHQPVSSPRSRPQLSALWLGQSVYSFTELWACSDTA